MSHDSLDVASPRLSRPGSVQLPPTRGRYLSIDVLRAVAILLMIQVHAVDYLAADIRSRSPASYYNLSEIFGYMAAPIFTLLSGLSFALWLDAQRRLGRKEEDIVKYGLRRGMLVFALGLAVNIFIELPENTFDWDILALLGVSAIILTLLRDWRLGILIAICVVIVIVTPLLQDVVNYQSYWPGNDFEYENESLGELFIGLVLTAYFPLLPWLVFPLAGFALGRIAYGGDREASLTPRLALVGVLLFALALIGALVQPQVPDWLARYYATGWPRDAYLMTTVHVLGALGGVLVCLWLLNRAIDLNPKITGRGSFFTFLRRYSYFSLTAYIAHLAVLLWPLYVFAWLYRKSALEFYVGKVASVPTALIAAVVLIAVLYLLLIVFDRYKKCSLENFMRWICD